MIMNIKVIWGRGESVVMRTHHHPLRCVPMRVDGDDGDEDGSWC